MSDLRLDRLEQLRRRRSPHCLSDLQLDQLMLARSSELDRAAPPLAVRRSIDGPEAARMDHLQSCDACRVRHDARVSAHGDFARMVDVHQLAESTNRRVDQRASTNTGRRWRWFVPMIAGVAAAAAAVVLVWRSAPRTEELELRSKGGASLTVFVKRGDVIRMTMSGDDYRERDTLKFAYSSRRSGHLAIFGVEHGGRTTCFVPYDAASPLPIESGQDVALAQTIELDDSKGRELLLGVVCPSSFSVEEVRRKLQETGQATAAAATSTDALGLPAACVLVRHWMNKR